MDTDTLAGIGSEDDWSKKEKKEAIEILSNIEKSDYNCPQFFFWKELQSKKRNKQKFLKIHLTTIKTPNRND